MCEDHHDELWLAFPKTIIEFEERFPDEQACREYWMKLRWNGHILCDSCGHDKTWALKGGKLFECAKCNYKTSLTSGTLLARTRKPLRLWFRAMWEICVHQNGISAKDLQRIMGFGSYKTAWSWLHKLRRACRGKKHAMLATIVELDEAFVGGKGSEKSMVFVAIEVGGRVRMVHAPNNDEGSIKAFADREIEPDAKTKTDGLASYNERSLSDRPHEVSVQTKAEKREEDTLQNGHWAISYLKRWLLGTHHGAIAPKHLQSYLDEFCFRRNRRKTKGVGRIVARCMENLVNQPPLTMRQLIDETEKYRFFQNAV